MFADTRPADLTANGGLDRWAEFRVAHPQERRALLRQLRDGSVPVNLSGPGGGACTTMLWSIEEHAIGFDAGAHGTLLEPLLEGGELVAVAYLDAVKLQFDLHDAMLVHGAQATLLRAAMPSEIYRFQRRQAYRVRVIDRGSPVARLRHPSMPDMRLELRVLDVSLGGCALWLPSDVPPIAAGTLLAEVEITLDIDTHFHVPLRLQHVSALAPGSHGVRLGCEWQLSPTAERSVQRFVDQAQKRRRLLSLR
jgi:c-di-GMP-binding flagellar brake protein YcgR